MLIAILLIIAICAIVYRGALHEFQILQKDYKKENKWSDFLSEKLPLVVRNLPKSWLGNWTYERTKDKSWNIITKRKEAWSEWIKNPILIPKNMEEIGFKAKLNVALNHWENFRRWFWIPTGNPIPYVLSTYIGLKKTTAEGTLLVSTDGAPLEVWVSHEAGVPITIAEELYGMNPWIQSTNEIPGVEQVKFIEIRLRPGNAILLPCHWWYAIRPNDDTSSSWFWMHEFHSPISWIATKIRSKN